METPSTGPSPPQDATEPPPARAPAYQYFLSILLAIVGGLLGIVGAVIQEVQSTTTYILLPFLGAPIIEEALKPSGIYLALLWWPHALHSQIFTAALCAISGVVFGVIESFVYVTLYVEDASDEFIVFRFSVPLGLHAACSYLFGLGLNQRVIDWAAGRSKLPRASRNFFIAAVALHARPTTRSPSSYRLQACSISINNERDRG